MLTSFDLRKTSIARGIRIPTGMRLLRGLAQIAVVGTVGASLLTFGLQAIQGVFLARILGPEGRGEFGTIVFYTQTLTYIGLLGTGFSIARRAASEASSIGPLTRSALRVGLCTGTLTMLVVTVLGFVALPDEKRYLAPLCALGAFTLPWEHMRLSLLSVDHGTADFSRYNTNRVVTTALFPATLLFVWLFGLNYIPVVVLLWVLVSVLGFVQRCKADWGNGLAGKAEPSPHRLIVEGVPYVFSIIASDLFSRLDLFLILWLADLVVQGYYVSAVPAASLLTVVPAALALFAFNAGAKPATRSLARRFWILAVGVIALQLGCAFAFAVVIGPLIKLVYGAEFAGAVPFALALLPAQAFNGIGFVADGYLRGRNKSALGVYSRLVGAVVMAVLVWMLFPRWREMSVPLAASVGHALAAATLGVAVALDVFGRRKHSVACGGSGA